MVTPAVREEASKKKKAFGTETQQSVGAQMSAKVPGASPEAPTSVGQLMTPSTFGREAPAGNEEEMGKRVERNKSFLSSPDTQAALMQFGVAMLASAGRGNFASNFGQAIGLAAGMKGRMLASDRKLTKEQKELELEERRVKVQEGQLGIDEEKLSQEGGKKQNRKRLFQMLKNMGDEKLMEIAAELAADGDDEGARIALSMQKSANTDAAGLLGQYELSVKQGFNGTFDEWKAQSDTTSVLETIRQKIVAGTPLSPGEQEIWNIEAISDPILRGAIARDPDFLTKLGVGGAAMGVPAPPPPPVNPAATGEGTSGNVKFKVQ